MWCTEVLAVAGYVAVQFVVVEVTATSTMRSGLWETRPTRLGLMSSPPWSERPCRDTRWCSCRPSLPSVGHHFNPLLPSPPQFIHLHNLNTPPCCATKHHTFDGEMSSEDPLRQDRCLLSIKRTTQCSLEGHQRTFLPPQREISHVLKLSLNSITLAFPGPGTSRTASSTIMGPRHPRHESGTVFRNTDPYERETDSRNQRCLAAIAVPEPPPPRVGGPSQHSTAGSGPEVSLSISASAALHHSKAGPNLRQGIRSETAQI